jgi:hypothetical protein
VILFAQRSQVRSVARWRGYPVTMSQLPAADRMQSGGSSSPEANGAFVGPVILTALAAWRARIGLLTAAVLVLALANAPAQLAQWDASQRMEQSSARSEARGDRSPDPEDALQELQALGPACCNLCGTTLLGFFLVLPLTAGATVLGARAVRGNARFADMTCGFRRYVPTMGAALVTLLIGGGAAMAVGLINSMALIGSVSRAIAGIVTPGVLLVIGALIMSITLWLTARLWFAVVRVADPERPRIGGMASVTLSWQWTDGTVQMGMVGVVLVAMAVAIAALLPGWLAWSTAARDMGSAKPYGIAIAVVLMSIGGWFAGTFALALFGAAYERVAILREPIAPPVHDSITQHNGGMDA